MNDVMDTLSIPTITAKSRKRATNFSNSEKALLVNIVARHKDIIENKKTDGVTVAQKNEAWDAITREFNSSNAGTTRDLESLRRNYENRKKLLRQNMAKQRRELYRTGGGVAPVVTKEPGDEILMAIVNEKTIAGIENRFDGDKFDNPKPCTQIRPTQPELPQVTFPQDMENIELVFDDPVNNEEKENEELVVIY